jgi:hypothetical protein
VKRWGQNLLRLQNVITMEIVMSMKYAMMDHASPTPTIVAAAWTAAPIIVMKRMGIVTNA